MEGEEELLEPMSPSAQYLKSSALSLTILGVLEMEDDIDDSMTMSLLKDLFLPINPRFTSIMVTDKKGVRKWRKVEVNLEDHVNVPTFPSGVSVDYYDECFNDYLSKLATEQLPQDRPLWEIHILKYPTKNAAGNVIFKLHHSLGDGYSLMGALLSCLKRVDDSSLPLTFPSLQSSTGSGARRNSFMRRIPRVFTGLVDTAYDFGWSLLKSTSMKDDKSPIRSGADGVEFRPIATTTTTISIDQLKHIKNKLYVTINDVITGVILLGTRLYMQKVDEQSCKSNTTALVLLNTRDIRGYKSIDEMIKPNSDTPWGNQFAFLQVPLPKLTQSKLLDPLDFVKKSHRMIKRHKNSATIYLTSQFLSFVRKVKGHEATARYIHATLKNTSMAISNLIGPIEPMTLDNQPCKGLYFAVAGPPQSLSVTMRSYVGKLRIALTSEKGFIDQNKLKSCIEFAFEVIYKAAIEA
ncbi:wax ester synthase/diacylglycerol acyltransferase 4-like [Salvia miltiorrhiza]|uniref:wax ester synthase/diacylglycerol acyltransferase 4-like n=1 Tax=Salvia miltiorrhiza TaxID=226208 RepID=UPI0025ABFC01|nr:wax ester synthase/diacylglycerol acyltransferase 4-like [Salvia miltiorrhiza]